MTCIARNEAIDLRGMERPTEGERIGGRHDRTTSTTGAPVGASVRASVRCAAGHQPRERGDQDAPERSCPLSA